MSQTHESQPTNATVEVSVSIDDFAEVFDRLLPEAEAIDPEKVQLFRADLDLALHNAQLAVSWVEEHADEVSALHADPVALLQLSDVVGATMVAHQRIDRASSGEVQSLLGEGRGLRGLLLASAKALALAGVLSESQVAKIAKGHGPMDEASDCVALKRLFTENPDAIEQTPVTWEQVQRCGEVGTKLLRLLKPARGRIVADPELSAAMDLRDRFWTLVLRRYDQLWRCGAFMFGPEKVDAIVVPLQGTRPRRRPVREADGAEAAEEAAEAVEEAAEAGEA